MNRATEIKDLRHPRKSIGGVGLVILLNNGALITAEDEAMIQGLYSRDPGSFFGHLDKVAEAGSGKFMGQFYVGYGHKSIGDCGSITLFFEGVSMLAAKAIQDWPLYSGQECSTRYIDFASQPFVNPLGTAEGESRIRSFIELYKYLSAEMFEYFQQTLVPPAGVSFSSPKWVKGIKARVFDILGGLLPAGMATSLSWHTNIRQAADKLAYLRVHPLTEVREIAVAATSLLCEEFPNSFSHKINLDREAYQQHYMTSSYYLRRLPVSDDVPVTDFRLVRDGVDRSQLEHYRSELSDRPLRTELPKQVGECGTLTVGGYLDFRSFRDLQRHRSVIQRMPFLSPRHGFESWYLEQMPDYLRQEAEMGLQAFEDWYQVHSLGTGNDNLQYYVPMGYKVPVSLTGDLPALVYIAELRGKADVHPTLQKPAHWLADTLLELFATYGLVLHIEGPVDQIEIRRGGQDIVPKL